MNHSTNPYEPNDTRNHGVPRRERTGYSRVLCSHRQMFIACSVVAALALLGIFLGGMVLAFDNSLWPIDAYVLYFGQASHLLCIPISAIATLLAILNPRFVYGSRAWGIGSFLWLTVAVWTLASLGLSHYFRYGFPIRLH